MTIFHWIILRIRNISDNSQRQIQNTYFVFHKCFPKIVTFWGIVENMVQPDGPQMINVTWRMRNECCGTKATDTHSEHITLTVFYGKKWTRERASVMLLYVHCLSPLYLGLSLRHSWRCKFSCEWEITKFAGALKSTDTLKM